MKKFSRIAAGGFLAFSLLVTPVQAAPQLDFNPDSAIVQYTQKLQLEPNNPVIYHNRGCAYKLKKDFDKAIADFTRAIELDPNYSDAYNNCGTIYESQKRFDDAYNDYSRAVDANPDNVVALNNRGLLTGKMADYKQKSGYDAGEIYARAIADFNRAIELKPDYAEAYQNRGAVYACMGGKDDSAAKDLTRAIELGINTPEIFVTRGSCYSGVDANRALADFNRALELDPNYGTAYNNRGMIYFDQKDYQRAIADFNRAVELGSDLTSAFNNLGLCYYQLGDYDKAIDCYNRALSVNYNYQPAIQNMQVAYEAKAGGAQVVSERAVEGGGYEVTMRMPLFGNGGLSTAVLTPPPVVEPFPEPPPEVIPSMPAYSKTGGTVASAVLRGGKNSPMAAIGGFTGLIIDCRGIGTLNPVISPVVKNVKGVKLYGHNLNSDLIITDGVLTYEQDSSQAGRAGSNPLVIKAVRLEDLSANPVVSEEDGSRILIENGATGFLNKAAVVFLY